MKHLASFVLFCWCLVALAGCGGSTGPTQSDLSSGSGFKIRIGLDSSEVVNGGNLVVTAAVFDDENQPVSDDNVPVIFSATDQGVSWTSEGSGAEKLVGGQATAVLKWEDTSRGDTSEPSRACLVTANYRGAMAQVEILLIANSF